MQVVAAGECVALAKAEERGVSESLFQLFLKINVEIESPTEE